MKTTLLWGLTLVWGGIFALGAVTLERYAITPSPGAHADGDWPENSAIEWASGRDFQLVMFLHPKCPCSRASVEELNRLLARVSDRVDAHVVMVMPPGVDEHWAKSDLYRAASQIEGLRVHLDPAGIEARRFTAQSSGQVMLYGPGARLLFEGGITGARGHAGDNPGRALIERQIQNPEAEPQRFHVFGCTLFSAPSPNDWSAT